jgi:hypothetical protein
MHVSGHARSDKVSLASKPVAIGDHVDDWRVCWLGGWDKCRVFFVVMVEREYEQPVTPCNARVSPAESLGFRK